MVIIRTVTMVGLLGMGLGAQAESGHGAHWGYEGHTGPEYWSNLSHEFSTCGSGKRQSPININGSMSAGLKPIQFDYRPAQLDILNNGHTIQVNRNEGSSITVDGQRYDLLQFHFHTPSENTVGGKPYDMEMHLVHKNDRGELAVVGVFLKAGADNSVLSKAWTHMPDHAGDRKQVDSVSINPTDLLPANRSYNHFNGSLTTPPCSEGVKWFVMKAPVEVSESQVKKFARVVGNNARPVQPLNKRFVLAVK